MTISLSESGLSSADYAAIPDQTGSMAAEIVVQRYGPVWEDHPNDTDNGRTGDCFDAILMAEYLLRAYSSAVSDISAEYMPSEVSGITDASWTSVDCIAIDDIDYTIPISLASSGVPLARLFYVDTDGVLKYSECTDIVNNAFGAPVTVCSPSDDILRIAATSTTRVHYITETPENNRRFHYAEYNGSWSTTDSQVYWPFPVHGFDAVALDASEDLLVITSDLPPLIGSRVVGAEVQKEVDKVQGLVAFKVKNGRWSEWMPTDVIDRIPEDYRFARCNNRLSFHNDLLFTTYTRTGGASGSSRWAQGYIGYQYTRPAVTRSAGGDNWEFPELIPDGDTPFVILPRDDYLYAVSVSGTLRSPRCIWAGQTPVEYDVTSRVLQTESQAAEIRQSNASVANPPDSITDIFQGVLAAELPLVDDRLLLKYSLGYYIDDSAKRVQVSLEDVIQRGEQRGLPNLNLALGSQDYLGRVNRVRSDYAAEWPGMQCGRDPFQDITDTGYGGLRHMAPIKPSFKADDGILNLISKNKESIAISTFVTDALCGSAQCSIDLVNDDQSEYQGIVFRVFDKDNLYLCAYYPDDNVFRLYKRVGIEGAAADGSDNYEDTLLATSDPVTDTPSWASTQTDQHWMKVLVQYNKFTLYRSDDGLAWQVVPWTTGNFIELPGHLSNKDIVWSGRFGVIGYGYSEDDSPPGWVPNPWYPPEYPEPSNQGVIVLSQSQLARSFDFFTAEDPTWDDILGSITGTLYNIARGGSNQLFVTTTTGLWYCVDAAASSISWTCIKTDAAATTEAGVAGSFQALDADGDTVYATWHSVTTPGGYFSGGAAMVSFTAFNASIRCVVADRMNFCVDAGDGVIGCGTGSGGGALIHTIGGGYTQFPLEWGYITCVQNGFCMAWNTNMYQGYAPGTVYDINDIHFGIDVLGGMPLYKKAVGRDLYRAQVKIAEAGSVFGKSPSGPIGGRAIYTRNNTSEILWVVAAGAEPAPGALPNVAFMWTNDSFTNFHDKTGNFFTVIGDWTGATGTSGSHGNALAITFPYWDD